MVNGHGVMRLQGLGLASHVGVLLKTLTIGVAKRLIGGIYINQSTNIDHPNEQVRLIKLIIEYWAPFLGEDM
jgi:deoxyinosine 3'endonuclease (endonuclease V)